MKESLGHCTPSPERISLFDTILTYFYFHDSYGVLDFEINFISLGQVMQSRPPKPPPHADSLGGCIQQLSNITTTNIQFDVALKLMYQANYRVVFMTYHVGASVI